MRKAVLLLCSLVFLLSSGVAYPAKAPVTGVVAQSDATTYKVLVNVKRQYSVWPADRENPLGWNDAGKTGRKEECFAYISEIWPKPASTPTASPTTGPASPATLNKAQTSALTGQPRRKSLIELKPKQNEKDINVYRITKEGENKVEIIAERVTDPNTNELLTGKYLVGFGCKDGQIYVIEPFFDKGTSHTCAVRCTGFGAKAGEHTIMSGFPLCPEPAGTFTSTGPTSDCKAGLGDYVITISCPRFAIVTYITY